MSTRPRLMPVTHSQKRRPNLLEKLSARPYILGLLAAILFASSFLFFAGGPTYYSTRLFRSIWNLGHIFYFALFPLFIFTLAHKKRLPFLYQAITVFCIAVGLGIGIEYFQGNVARTQDLADIFRNVIGGLICLFFLLPGRTEMPPKLLKLLQTVTIFLLLTQLQPVIIAALDQYIATSSFPVLSDFESPFEAGRWKGKLNFSITNDYRHTGTASMRVNLETTTYSGISLHYFPNDWSTFTTLRFSVFNPSTEPLPLRLRIHDRQHVKNGEPYKDRFHSKHIITQGWHTIRIPLSAVQFAPQGRDMDLRHIVGVMFYVVRLNHPRTIYIDDVMLTL